MNKTYIIAEISANHCQDYEYAKLLVEIAKDVGADAVKLQTYSPDTMTIKCDRPEFKINGGTPWDNRNLYELYKSAYMPWEWQPSLKKLADDIGIELFSTAYDKYSVDFLESIGVSKYKIASFELTDLPFIKYVASKGKPIILSTVMAELDEITEVVNMIESCGNNKITLLKCVSAYPARVEDMHLLNIKGLMNTYNYPIGLSDHSLNMNIASVAVALGASVIEKHFTLSRQNKSCDNAFSLEPQEFKQMVYNIRLTEKALGNYDIKIRDDEVKSKVFRRSLFVVDDIKKGDIFNECNVRSIRPGFGLKPKYIDSVLGLKAKYDIERGTPLSWDMLDC
jgi:pseudaminic acid synthase